MGIVNTLISGMVGFGLAYTLYMTNPSSLPTSEDAEIFKRDGKPDVMWFHGRDGGLFVEDEIINHEPTRHVKRKFYGVTNDGKIIEYIPGENNPIYKNTEIEILGIIKDYRQKECPFIGGRLRFISLPTYLNRIPEGERADEEYEIKMAAGFNSE